MSTSNIAAVIFDLDGTLADTIGDLSAAVNSVLVAHHFSPHPLSRYKTMVGNGFSLLLKRALPPSEAGNDALFAQLLSEAAALYSATALDTTKAFPGIAELLAELRDRKIPCAVLSNKPDEMTRHMVEALFPGYPFMAVKGAKASQPKKPNPSGALEIAALKSFPLSSWAFVGDSDVDMETGKNSGMVPLGASWGYRSIEELRDHGASGILREPSDLLSYL